MRGPWQKGIIPKANHLKGMLVTDMVPAFLRQTYLLGVSLGEDWGGIGGDMAMQQLLNAAIADVQSKISISFERKVIKTDPDPGLVLGVDYDFVGERLSYVRPSTGQYYLTLPHSHIVSIERMRLFYGPQAVYTIPNDWINFTSKEGILRLLPVVRAGDVHPGIGPFYGFFGGHTFYDHVSDAWSVDYTIGYGQIDADIAHYIGLTAAIQVLAIAGAGHDISSGLASESLSQDGITESISYAQGKFGIYSGLIQVCKDELERLDINRKALAKRGIKIMVI